ncbi:MAG TPA: plastocyanin/azurin family copper-binding protein [Baekduia sp.]|uniref:plastocyanin/azurin family copper-binding protein n=1 Tax=Baekduia sp. TaxID=2600305 RepID=UPI002D7658FE|nr:plastocyanin/azurin family copper-binding protein [Baekduia sp.]HET6509330.1 plastocyanin/azurin family copper-binding protein [Baekduia sp.]
MTRLLTPLAAVTAAGALAAGCGSSGDSTKTTAAPAAAGTTATRASTTASSPSGAGSGAQLTLAADEQGGLSFTKKTLSAKAGHVTITMANPSGDSLPHAIAIEGHGVDQDGRTVQPGGTSTVTADLKPGTYTFYCPVDGHRQAGMKGTLTVR